MYYYYTSRSEAQHIICASPARLIPIPGGSIYLSPVLFVVGHEAANRLAFVTKCIEMACEIPNTRVSDPTSPRRVTQILDGDGNKVREGGGFYVTTRQPISVAGLQWISLREP